MKSYARTLFIICIVLIAAACSGRESAIEDLRTLVEDIRINGGEYTAEQWADAEGIFETVNDDLQQYEFTQGEKAEIAKLKGEYMAAIAQWKVQEKFGGVKDIVDQVLGAGNAVMEQLGSKDSE